MCVRVPAVVFVLLVAGAAAHAQVYGGRPTVSVRRQAQQASNELVKAYAAANANATLNEDVKKAQQAATASRKEYAAAVVEAKAAIPVTPELAGLREQVKTLQGRLDAEKAVSDWTARLAVCTELAGVRGRLNAIESEALLADADLAISRAAVADAQSAVKDALSRRQQAVQQDPRVLAARQRLDILRRQLRGK